MRRRVGLFLFCGLVLPLVIVANAPAQSSTVVATPGSATRGQPIVVTGSGYSQAGGVDIRLDFRNAEPMASTSVDTSGRFRAEFPVPQAVTPGVHLLIATQTTAAGRHRGFTPGRGKLRVLAAASTAGAAPGGAPGDGAPPALLLLAMTLIVLAGSAMLTVRRLRTPNRPLGDNAGLAR